MKAIPSRDFGVTDHVKRQAQKNRKTIRDHHRKDGNHAKEERVTDWTVQVLEQWGRYQVIERIGRNNPDSAALLGVQPPHLNSNALVAAAYAQASSSTWPAAMTSSQRNRRDGRMLMA